MEYSETGFASPTIKLEPEQTNGRTTVNGKSNHLELSPCHERSESDCSAISSSSEAKVKHARFNIEKVASPTQPNDNIGHNQTTLHDTIGYATHEAVPLTMFYRNEASQPGKSKQRPTLAELHKGFDELDEENDDCCTEAKETDHLDTPKIKIKPAPSTSVKFGWVKGVLVPCLLNIWGVILYLRLPRLTGQAGVVMMSVIILLSAVVTTITTLSMSAICTNGEVKGGGAYYLISRSLGPEFGGSIGIIFSLANAVGVALYVVGFGETVQKLMGNADIYMVDQLNDVRIIGCIVIVLLLGITLIGLEWVIKTQMFLLMILIASMFSYVIGSFTGNAFTKTEVLRQQGFTSYSGETFKDNFLPEFRNENFFTIFSIFFPAATGILAGVNISGDLKNPQYAIPKGTLTAIVLTTAVYIALTWVIGATSVKDAIGVITVATASINQTSSPSNMTSLLSNSTSPSPPTATSCIPNCKYGLLNDTQLMERVSLIGPLVLAGIFAATLSSALASLVGSPKTFQAVCRDGIFKGIEYFGKGSGASQEPRRAYVLTFFISTGFILVGSLDIIAPIISNFFLMSYALINYSVFAASLGKSPGWRPAFKYYNMWLSLLGCFLCIGIMFLINWWAALITIVMVMALYKYVDFKKPEINWGSSGQAHSYIKALKMTLALSRTDTHVKNFRPQCLVLCGAPSTRPSLVFFVSFLTKHIGLMICGQVEIKPDGAKYTDISTERQERWLQEKKIKAFVVKTCASNLRQGAQALMQCSGLGKLRPNIVILGFKSDWESDSIEKIDEYINIIHDSFDAKFNVAILRMPMDSTMGDDEGSDAEYDEELDSELEGAFEMSTNNLAEQENNSPEVASVMQEEEESSVANDTPMLQRTKSRRKKVQAGIKPDLAITMNQNFKGYIDVWWLFDDGGLTMLLPYLLSRNKLWTGCSIRVLTPAAEKNLKSNQVRMASLLKKFRITFSGIVEVQGINSKPTEESIQRFRESRIRDEISSEDVIDKKTLRQIRLGELVQEHSNGARLIVLTMPIPRKGMISNLLFMSWLEVISQNVNPPILLVRGNQTNVLTFYS